MKKIKTSSFIVLGMALLLIACEASRPSTVYRPPIPSIPSIPSPSRQTERVATQVSIPEGVSNKSLPPNGVYYIINEGSRKALTIPVKDNYRVLSLQPFKKSELQRWQLIKQSNGKVIFKLYDTPNWYMYFNNSTQLSTQSNDQRENFSLKPVPGTTNRFYLHSTKYGNNALLWDGSENGYTGTDVAENTHFFRWILAPAN